MRIFYLLCTLCLLQACDNQSLTTSELKEELDRIAQELDGATDRISAFEASLDATGSKMEELERKNTALSNSFWEIIEEFTLNLKAERLNAIAKERNLEAFGLELQKWQLDYESREAKAVAELVKAHEFLQSWDPPIQRYTEGIEILENHIIELTELNLQLMDEVHRLGGTLPGKAEQAEEPKP